jgi:hypothetical protein
MTKEQFLDGTPFYIGKKSYAGDSTYNYSGDPGCICKQSRSSIDERVIIDDYECNINKVGRIGFTGFTHVMGKKVVIKYKFSDLVPFNPETSVGE